MSGARYRDAALWRRSAALAMDGVLLVSVFAALNLVLWKSGVGAALAPDPDSNLLELWRRPEAAASLVLVFGMSVPLAWRTLGGTPGALLLGLVLISPDGQRPGLARSFARLAVALALGGVGLLWSLGGRPALHDRVSGVRLVIEDESCMPLPASARTARP